MAAKYVVAIGIALVAVMTSTSLLVGEPSGPCINDPRVNLGEQGSFSVSPCNVFSDTYAEARQRFRQAAQKVVGAQLYSIPIVIEEDMNYTTDVAILVGNNQSGLVVHSSGVHGIEGYAGSAIQIAWLKLLQSQQQQHANNNNNNNNMSMPTMVLIHAVNPWGMAHYRRWNENNVDLNRNGLHQEEWPMTRNRDPNVAHYEDLRPLFCPASGGGRGHYSMIASLLQQGVYHLWKYGSRKIKKAMAAGQYHDPNGIFYGGTHVEKSISALLDFLLTRVVVPTWDNNKDADTPSRKVTWVDVHTGLGKYGVDTLLLTGQQRHNPPNLAEVFEGSAVVGGSSDANKVADGYDLTIGVAREYFRRLFVSPSNDREDDNHDVWMFAQEFGTVSKTMVGAALVLENAEYHHERQKSKEERDQQPPLGSRLLQESFYVKKASWRKMILTAGIRVINQAIRRTTGQ